MIIDWLRVFPSFLPKDISNIILQYHRYNEYRYYANKLYPLIQGKSTKNVMVLIYEELNKLCPNHIFVIKNMDLINTKYPMLDSFNDLYNKQIYKVDIDLAILITMKIHLLSRDELKFSLDGIDYELNIDTGDYRGDEYNRMIYLRNMDHNNMYSNYDKFIKDKYKKGSIILERNGYIEPQDGTWHTQAIHNLIHKEHIIDFRQNFIKLKRKSLEHKYAVAQLRIIELENEILRLKKQLIK